MTTESRANAAQRTSGMPFERYQPFAPIDLPDRTWPSKVITEAPLWCSVDLRDGNQALIEPMDSDRKWKMFLALVDMGFTEIEVGFPSASDTDFQFVREIIEQKAIPEGVKIQVLTQARPELIRRTYESIDGAPQAIVHLYNSTSTLQRKVVFGLDEDGIIDIAVKGAELCRSLEDQVSSATEILYEYSPESFTGTELPFAKRVCDTVVDVLNPNDGRKTIINLPATVEMSSANIYGDMIEWMHRNLARREDIILSLHPHNDRGTGVAAAEFGVMAGADRVEGTLFGNGERTGNVDIITLAMNMYSQGIDPMLDMSDINELKRVAQHCNQLPVHPRHPYVGELVYTAFSGSHQDAIKKSWDKQTPGQPWDVLYIPVDPADIGRNYKAIIRINSQSGKGGVAYILEQEFGYILPKGMHREFGPIINRVADTKGEELSADDLHGVFRAEYLDRRSPIEIHDFRTTEKDRVVTCEADVSINGEAQTLTASGNGPINAFVTAIREAGLLQFEFLNYSEHSIGSGARAQAISYIQIKPEDGPALYGAGIDTSIEIASIKGVVSAINRALAR